MRTQTGNGPNQAIHQRGLPSPEHPVPRGGDQVEPTRPKTVGMAGCGVKVLGSRSDLVYVHTSVHSRVFACLCFSAPANLPLPNSAEEWYSLTEKKYRRGARCKKGSVIRTLSWSCTERGALDSSRMLTYCTMQQAYAYPTQR